MMVWLSLYTSTMVTIVNTQLKRIAHEQLQEVTKYYQWQQSFETDKVHCECMPTNVQVHKITDMNIGGALH